MCYKLDEIEKFINEAQKIADRIDHAVLVKAFSGELVPQDQSDVAASLLLEQINRIERKGISNDVRAKTLI